MLLAQCRNSVAPITGEHTHPILSCTVSSASQRLLTLPPTCMADDWASDADAAVWTAAELASLQLYPKSAGKVARELQQQARHDLLNYLRSINLDAEYVRSAVAACRVSSSSSSSLPVFANLRNGLWYAAPSDWAGTCYFKSSDGHSRRWSFSYTRLNSHLACAAGKARGCIIVDSTRRGKQFPDSFTATVPLWAAVLNRYSSVR
jgi:tRNA A64-2'-O-ribosylphosphate transferase